MEIIARTRNPYKIEGPAQVGVSGGRTSARLLREILAAHDGKLPDDVFLTFENTGKESEKTLIFLHEMETRWPIKIHWLEYCRIYGRDDLPRYKFVDFETASRSGEPFDMFLKYYDDLRTEKGTPLILPNHANKMCSDRLKTKGAEWIMRSLGYERWDAVLGIRYDEPRRYNSHQARNLAGGQRWDTVMPLYEAGITNADVLEFWRKQPFDLGIDSDLGNCDLCFKKHPSKIMRAIVQKPELADWWIAHEDRTGQTFRSDYLSYRHLKYYALQMDKQQGFDFAFDESDESVDCACTD